MEHLTREAFKQHTLGNVEYASFSLGLWTVAVGGGKKSLRKGMKILILALGAHSLCDFGHVTQLLWAPVSSDVR